MPVFCWPHQRPQAIPDLYQSDDNNNADNGQPHTKAKLTQNPLILIVEILSHHLVAFIKWAEQTILPIEGHILAMIAICLKKPCFSGRLKKVDNSWFYRCSSK